MDYKTFRERLFDTALRSGCTGAETYRLEDINFSVGVLDQKIDNYSVSRAVGIGLRVQVDGHNGYAYTEAMDDPDGLVAYAIDNARSIETTDEHPLQIPQPMPHIDHTPDPLCALGETDKIEAALRLERLVLAHGDPVTKSAENMLQTTRRTVSLHNTNGLAAEETSDQSIVFANPVAKRGEEVRDAYAFRCASEDLEAVADEAVQKAVAKLGATPVAPGKYRVLLQAEAAGTLLGAFVPMFSADNAQKGLSLLAGKEGETIAAAGVDILDDPFHAVQPRAFDAEGTPSQTTRLVEAGVLRSLLHNLKTAKKAGVATTSNGGRASAGSPVGVSPSNLYVVPGTASFDQLVETLGNGLIITEMSGTHAGVNTVSGDFSLLSGGFLVENGKIVRAVDQITVAGTFFSLMAGISEIGSDLRFGFPGNVRIGAPSLLVDSLTVAGQ